MVSFPALTGTPRSPPESQGRRSRLNAAPNAPLNGPRATSLPFAGRLRGGWGAWTVAVLGFALIYLLFLPRICGIKDEVGFINQAWLWIHGGNAQVAPSGHARIDTSGQARIDSSGQARIDASGHAQIDSSGRAEIDLSRHPATDLIPSHGRLVSWRNPGRSLTLLPFLGLRSTGLLYVTSLLFHIAIAFAAGRLLRKLGAPSVYAVLVLFHPTLALYSRTIMADAPAGLFVLLAAMCLIGEPKRGFSAGLALGAAAVFRYQIGLLLPFLFLEILTRPGFHHRIRQSAACLAGGAVVGIPLVVYNWYWFGNPLGFTGQGWFSFSMIWAHLRVYVPALLVFWPLMLLSPFFDPSHARRLTLFLSLPLLGLMLLYSWHDEGGSPVETWIIGLRLLQPVLPLWIVSYASALHRRIGERLLGRRRAGLAAVIALCLVLVLLAGQAALFSRHQRHLERLEAVRSAVIAAVPAGSTVVGNETVRKLFALLPEEVPPYHWLAYESRGAAVNQARTLAALPDGFYLALLPKRPGYELPDVVRGYVDKYRMTRVETDAPDLLLYKTGG